MASRVHPLGAHCAVMRGPSQATHNAAGALGKPPFGGFPVRRSLLPMAPQRLRDFSCLEESGVAGQSVLVSGCGPIGLTAIAAARALGADTIIASDPNGLRRDQVEKSGADHTLDPAPVKVVQAVSDITGDVRVDVAIELSGNPDGFRANTASVFKGSDFSLVGAPAHPLEIDLTRWLQQCPRIINIRG